MSGANRGQGSAASDYHNQENMLSRLRGSIKARVTGAGGATGADNQENLPPKQAANAAAATTRTVLGALQNNQRSKAQTQRGSKQVSVLEGRGKKLKVALSLCTSEDMLYIYHINLISGIKPGFNLSFMILFITCNLDTKLELHLLPK